MADTDFSTDATIGVSLSFRYLLSSYPANDRDPALDQEFDCEATDVHGRRYAGIPIVELALTGEWLNQSFGEGTIDVEIVPTGTWDDSGFHITDGVIEITVGFSSGLLATEMIVSPSADGAPYKSNWVKWSKIGAMDFTIWKGGVAGERPLPWRSWVYCIKKLGNRAVAYGKNGVSVLSPSGKAWGEQTIYRIGLKSKQAVAGDESVHYFIDKESQLFSLGERLQKLDYSEYLTSVTSPVLSYDLENDLLYICDGTHGYVYSPKDKSLGAGPVNISGLSSQDGTLYAVSPATITTPAFEICTDIYDMGTRNAKTIYWLEIGTNLTGTLQAAIYYRESKAGSFTSTSWFAVDTRGMVFITCYASEFKFRVKNLAYESFELDYINPYGEVHSH